MSIWLHELSALGIAIDKRLFKQQKNTKSPSLIMKILFNEKDIKIICVVYRPESVKVNFFLDEFEKLNFLQEQKLIIIFGVFNIDTLVESCDLSK